jgi:olefin beta-lactone synthetase
VSQPADGAATLPPAGLAGLDPSWSRLVHVPDVDGVGRTFHVLDRATDDPPELTLLCVHGNPTWSYLFRTLVGRAPAGVRVVAVDQLDMGFSERTGRTRRLATRVDDLTR